MAPHEFRFAHLPQETLGSNAQILVLGNEQAQLVGQVRIGLVVRRRRQQDAPALVLPDVLLNRAVSLALTVPQVVALVDQHQAVAAQVRQIREHAAHRQHAGAHPVPFAVVLPHGDEVLRADDQRLQPVVVLEHARERGGHEGLAQPDDVADEHAAPLVQMMRGDLHGRRLEVEKLVAEVARNAKLGQAGPRLLRQVVGDLDVDVMGRNQSLARPALLDDRGELVRDVDAPTAVPAVLEPAGELLAGVLIEHVHVELALKRQSGLREVAAAQVRHRGADQVRAEQQIEPGMEGMPEKEPDHHLPCPDLPRQLPQAGLVLIRRRAEGQLLAELLGQSLLEPQRRLIVELKPVGRQRTGRPWLLVRQPLHADEDAAAVAETARPSVYVSIESTASLED